MKLIIDGEPKEIAQLLREVTNPEAKTEIDIQLGGIDWKSQSELIKKISADCSGNCNLRISGHAIC